MADKIRLLQFSDTHFLYSEDAGEDDYLQLRERFKEDLNNMKNERGAVDCILICGDIANKGKKEEYDSARKFINSISSVLEVDDQKPNVFVIPGNHDIDRNIIPYTRQLLCKGLLGQNGDSTFTTLKKEEPIAIEALYSSLSQYNDFAATFGSVDGVSETIMSGTEDQEPYAKKKVYWVQKIGELSGYNVNLYGLNSTLVCDGNDAQFPASGTDKHSVFIPSVAYNILDKDNEINISMVHHPLDWMIGGDKIETKFDDRFKVQFFGHIHKQSSRLDNVMRIFSGALQPEEPDDEEYCPVYNLIELEVKESVLHIELFSRKWDGTTFVKFDSESKPHDISLKRQNHWAEGKDEIKEIIPVMEKTSVPINEIIYMFVKHPKVKNVIKQMNPGSYMDDKPINENIVLFLKWVRENSKFEDLYNLLR